MQNFFGVFLHFYFGIDIDTSARVNIMSTYYAGQAAVRTVQAVKKFAAK